jgi:acetolactate synthase-1/2/3 large subunit
LHEIDQHAFIKALTKASLPGRTHAEIVPTLFEAWRIATTGEPGPVFVEIPVNLQMFPGEVAPLPPLPVIARNPAVPPAPTFNAPRRC